ncbi:hypothetical protein [Veillonella magna]|uniref:hypothetical protein n=1 Tax=Veillonella magna TaxID=464322 RepID=UPI0023F011D7|nr:hypothetical protein [Veillonella magna]
MAAKKDTVLQSTDTEKNIKDEKKKTSVDETVAYVGPNIIKLGLIKNQVYINGLPKTLDSLAEEQLAVMKRLFVPLSALSQALNEVRMKDKPLYLLNEAAKEVRYELEKGDK